MAGWVISEGAGIRTPDPEIFRFAAIRAGQPLDGDRPWPLTAFQPGHPADSFPHAVGIVLAARV